MFGIFKKKLAIFLASAHTKDPNIARNLMYWLMFPMNEPFKSSSNTKLLKLVCFSFPL